MDVRCDKCQARYRIDDARVGPQGLAMRCGKCGNTFRATREVAQHAAAAPTAARPAATPAAPAAVAPRPTPKPSEGATVMFAAPAISGGAVKHASGAGAPAAATAPIAAAAPPSPQQKA